MTTQPDTKSNVPNSKSNVPKIILVVALFGVAAWLIASRYGSAATDWYLGNLRRDPGDLEAREGLRRLGERALPRLEKELGSADRDARVVAVIALSVIEGPNADALIARAAADDDDMTASNAVHATSFRRDAGTASALGKALGDPRRQVRLAARHAAERRSGLPWWGFGRIAAQGG